MKFRCKACDYVANLDNLLEDVYCPKCGKKYHNQYFVKPVVEEPVAEEQPVVEAPAPEPEVSCVRRLNPAKIKAKKSGFAALLAFALLFLAGVAVVIAFNFVDDKMAAMDVVKANYMFVLVGLAVLCAAAAQVNAANIKLAAVKTIGTDHEVECCCPKVKSAKVAGYAFALVFGLVMLVAPIALFVVDALDGTMGALDYVKAAFTGPTFISAVAGLVAVTYFSYRINRLKKD